MGPGKESPNSASRSPTQQHVLCLLRTIQIQLAPKQTDPTQMSQRHACRKNRAQGRDDPGDSQTQQQPHYRFTINTHSTTRTTTPLHHYTLSTPQYRSEHTAATPALVHVALSGWPRLFRKGCGSVPGAVVSSMVMTKLVE
jgi:hypothetical protein